MVIELRFLGCLIEESLFDPAVVASWAPFVQKVVSVPEDPDATVWHVNWYRVAEEALLGRLDALAAAMKPNWYGHFWAGDRLCVILPGRIFWLPTSYTREWDEMIEYGESVGVERRWTERIPTVLPDWVAEALAEVLGRAQAEVVGGDQTGVEDRNRTEVAEPSPADDDRHGRRIQKEAASLTGIDAPRTCSSIATDLRTGGLHPGMHLLVHTRLSALGWIAGGPVALIQALQDVLTSAGTLVMPAFSGDLSEPAHWSRPPVPEDWWATIRREMPPFDPQVTPTRALGRVPELFRSWPGVRRSSHPQTSFSAWGREALYLTVDHQPEHDLGDESPLGRLYQLDGWSLFLGTDFRTCTALHLSEYRSGRCQPLRQGAPVMTASGRRWHEWDSLDYDSEAFPAIGSAYLESAAEADVRRFRVGSADCLLLRLRPLVDFGTAWMRQQR